jgi:hypothetical protein
MQKAVPAGPVSPSGAQGCSCARSKAGLLFAALRFTVRDCDQILFIDELSEQVARNSMGGVNLVGETYGAVGLPCSSMFLLSFPTSCDKFWFR